MYPKCSFASNIHLVQIFYVKSKQVNLSLRQHFIAICKYLVYDNFDCPFFVAKYHPAEYSFEYSKSVSHENSKCVDFVSAQVKHTVQDWPFFLSFQTE